MDTEKNITVPSVHHHKSMGHLAHQPITDIIKFSTMRLVKVRLPWLLVGLVGGMMATLIVRHFEGALLEKLALAFFIPVIVYMSDAVGTQTETLFIRALVIEKINFKKYLAKEIVVGFLLGAALGILLFIYSMVVFNDTDVSFIVAISITISSVCSVIVATLVPLALRHFGRDPAIGAGPFTTIVQDILALFIYFIIAAILI
jgi:magnesium transporter